MKKTTLIAVGAFVIGFLISPFIGMAISPIRDLILGMASDKSILALGNKINEFNNKNQQQDQKINELKNYQEQEKQRVENEKKQKEKALQLKSIAQCETKQLECSSKINKLNERIKDSKGYINRDKKEMEKCKKDKYCSLNNHKKVLEQEEKFLLKTETSLNGLINGECKDYQNACE